MRSKCCKSVGCLGDIMAGVKSVMLSASEEVWGKGKEW